MPQGDRTGPMGQGPGTGRALGFCSGYDTLGHTKGFGAGRGRGPGFGRGRGRGMGYGRGRNSGGTGTGFFHNSYLTPSMSKNDEIKLLKSQMDSLKRTQKDIENRLNELGNESD